MPKISCIIPAHNEEKTIGYVVKSARNSRVFQEVIVVNDGSLDHTAQILTNEKGIIFINLPQNVGKGGAVWHGLAQATGDIILMLDADLIGLTKYHFRTLLKPLITKKADVCVGIVMHKEKKWTSFIQRNASDLSGQQAFWKKDVIDANIKNTRFGLEIALKNHFKNKSLKIEKIFLEGVKHFMKEEKMGVGKGLTARMKMYREVGKAMAGNVKSKFKNQNAK